MFSTLNRRIAASLGPSTPRNSQCAGIAARVTWRACAPFDNADVIKKW
jgi:hypothetical protein